MDDGDEVIEFRESRGVGSQEFEGLSGETNRVDPFQRPFVTTTPTDTPRAKPGKNLWKSLQDSIRIEKPIKERTQPSEEDKEEILRNSAILKDSSGKPLFPSLYKLRLESESRINQSTQNLTSAIKSRDEEWRVSRNFSSAMKQSRATVVGAISARGQSVRTAFGVGRVMTFNTRTEVYEVRLSFGTLYTKSIKNTHDDRKKRAATNLELNSAYENWEKARRSEVESECQQLGIDFDEKMMTKCFACVKEPRATKAVPSLTDGKGNALFPALYKLRQNSQDAINARKKLNPCLLCSSVACSDHSCKAFRKEGITVCNDCVYHLEYDFNSATLPDDLHHQKQQLIELYGRAVLLLGYCSQFMLSTADSLEEKTKQHNQIGVGGSSAGLVSGVLGVAAAATILTPAGPPLLVASLVFGGSATAVQTGSEAYKYYCEPNQWISDY